MNFDPLVGLVGFAGLAVIFFRWLYRENVAYMETSEAVALLLDQGMALSKKNWHLWQGAKDEYVLLGFDNKSNPIDNTEERFPGTPDGRNDAVAKFLQKIKKGA